MNILVREPQGTWRPIQSHKYEGEGSLQDLLNKSPGIIPLESLGGTRRLPRLFVREVGLSPSSGADLIGIDEEGGITIVECKLASNPEIKRKVIGQLLEHAGYLSAILSGVRVNLTAHGLREATGFKTNQGLTAMSLWCDSCSRRVLFSCTGPRPLVICCPVCGQIIHGS